MQKYHSLSLKKSYYHHFLVGFFVFMVSFVGAALISSALVPVGETSAQTVTVDYNNTGYYVAVTSDDNIDLSVDATPVGQTVVSPASTVNVKTNAPLGYKLYLSTSNDELTSADSAISQTFKPVTSGSLTNNTWGFSKTGTDNSWLAVPEVTAGNEASGYLLSSKSEPNLPDGDNINIYYGVNSDTTMPSGTYTTTVTYTAIGDGVPEEHTMQEFTMSECINMPVDKTFYLIDSRNNKIYSIIHAKDGNCWMTENLKYQNVESSNWNTNDYSQELLHIATNEGYAGEYYYNYTSAINVCPTGWTLPVRSDTNTDKSYTKLMNAYNVTKSTQLMDGGDAYILGFHKYYGNWDYGYDKEYYQGLIGGFWTSTVPTNSGADAYFLYYDAVSVSGNVYAYQRTNPKGIGLPVRCVYDAPTMQEFSATDCANINTDTQFTLTDSRNNKTYKVVKAKDGNCWMADNLSIYNQQISDADSNLPTGTTITLPESTNWNTNDTTNMKIHVATNSGYEGEVYYNWCSAIGQANCGNFSVEGMTINTSICPKGWRLPINGDTTQDLSYAKLMDAYKITTGAELLAQTSLGFTKYYGYWHWIYVSEGGQGASGNFWSSTAYSDTNAYDFLYHSTAINPQNYTNKGHGFSIRCVMGTSTMQDFSAADCANMPTGSITSLVDSRNDKAYSIVKAKDGNCWMADNLAIYNQTISSADSDLPAGTTITLPESTTWNTNDTTDMRVHIATNSGYKGQVYYNWVAATGGSTASSGTVNQSICPKGWRLPINGSNTQDKSYTKLIDAYNVTDSAQLMTNSNAVYILGFHKYYGRWSYITNVAENNQGTVGYYWSSSAWPERDTFAYLFVYDTSTNPTVKPQFVYEKGFGFNVRCVLK